MTDEKLVELAKLVLHQTNFGNLGWEETAVKNTFQTTIAKYVIRISECQSKYEQGETDYVLSLINHEGLIIESFDDVQLSNWIKVSPQPSDVNGYVIMKDIFVNAKRKAMGVDKALDDVLKELGNLPPF
jgi:hypothetical protein